MGFGGITIDKLKLYQQGCRKVGYFAKNQVNVLRVLGNVWERNGVFPKVLSLFIVILTLQKQYSVSAIFTVHAFMSVGGILASRLAKLQPPLGDGASLTLHVPTISRLFTLPQKPSPFSFQHGSLRDGKALAPFSVSL